MNYFEKMNSLVKEAFTFKQYKRLNIVIRIIVFIFTLPLLITTLVSTGLYYLLVVGYKFFSMPYDVLKKFLDEELKEMHFVPQTAIYLVCLPFVFGLKVGLAFFSLWIGISYFGLTISYYIYSLAGITFKPFILDEVERDYTTNYKKLGFKGTLFGILLLVIMVLFCLDPDDGLPAVGMMIDTLLIVLYPMFLFKLERDEAPVEEVKEEAE